MRACIRYESIASLLRDHQNEFSQGGVLLRLATSGGVERGSLIDIEVVTPLGETVLRGEVLQVIPRHGIAVTFSEGADDLMDMVKRATRQSDLGGLGSSGVRASIHSWLTAPEIPNLRPGESQVIRTAFYPIKKTAEDPPKKTKSKATQSRGAQADDHTATTEAPTVRRHDAIPEDVIAAARPSLKAQQRAAKNAAESAAQADYQEKIKLAMHGDQDTRASFLRERNRNLLTFLLKNPGLTTDELMYLARRKNIPTDILAMIARNTDWNSRPELALTLLKNPMTPMTVIPILATKVPHSDLRRLSKLGNLREGVLREIRKRVL